VSGETDEGGMYTIGDLLTGDYIVSIWNQGWISQFYDVDPADGEPDPVSVIAGEDHGGIDFILVQAGTVSGRVFESDGITPIANIGVDVTEGGHGVCTDDTGFYSIASLPFGTHDIVAGRDFCGVGGYAESVVHGITLSSEVPHVEGLDFILDRAASISGRVVDAISGEGIPGIWVEVNYYIEDSFQWAGGDETDAEGNYFVTGLGAGDYRICIWAPSWHIQCYEMQPPESATKVTLVTGEQRGGINFSLTPAGTISGRVFDSTGTNPLPNIGVDVVEGGFGACTDENGYYLIGSLPFGTYDIVAGRDFCGETRYAESVVEGVTISTAAPYVFDLDFHLQEAGSISGRVLESGLQTGIPGILVEVNYLDVDFSWAGGAHTNADGFYSVPRLAPGDYRVCIWDPAWDFQCYFEAVPPAFDSVSVSPGQETPGIDFLLSPASPT
jgi:hypothetical protein